MADLLYGPIQLQSQPVVRTNYIVIYCDFSAMGHSSGQDLWEWAIASHGRLLVPPGWLQVICVGHCSICQSKIFLAHR